MAKIDVPSKLADTALMATVAKLRRRHRGWLNSRRPDDLYAFLNSVLRCYAAWRRDGIELSASGRITKLTGLNTSRRRHPIRAIIDATSTADRRTKSRWYRALRYAWRERDRWGGLKKCLRASGGIAGCADRWASLQAENKTPSGCVRIGGEDRFPRIPLYVDATLLDLYGHY